MVNKYSSVYTYLYFQVGYYHVQQFKIYDKELIIVSFWHEALQKEFLRQRCLNDSSNEQKGFSTSEVFFNSATYACEAFIIKLFTMPNAYKMHDTKMKLNSSSN